MKHFDNIVKLNDTSLDVELNNVKLGFANALRRIIVAEIPIHCIDDQNIEFIENTSMLHNWFLTKRLTLLPIKYLKDIFSAIFRYNFEDDC